MARRVEERLHGSLYLLLQRLRRRPIGRCVKQLRAWEQLDGQAYARLSDQFLAGILRYACEHVPLYRSGRWRTALSCADPLRLSSWPVLEKHTAITHVRELEARPALRGTRYRYSSASTGPSSLRVAIDPATAGWSWAHEYRALQWHGINVGAHTLACMHNMLKLTHTPRLANWVLNRKGCFADQLTLDRLDELAYHLVHGKVRLCWGLPSVMFQLSRHVRVCYPHAPYPLASVIKLGGEPVYPFQRREIRATLGPCVTQNYGCTEVGPIASECPAGRLHIFTTHVHVEVFHGDRPAPIGEPGDLVITSLGNRAMPLIRSRIGDRGRLSPDPCSCGLPLPVLDELQSHRRDTLYAFDGTPIPSSALWPSLDDLFAATSPRQVRQVQFQQIDEACWRVLVEGDIPVDGRLTDRLERIVWSPFGRACRVEVRHVPLIRREDSGKFRYYRTPRYGAPPGRRGAVDDAPAQMDGANES